MKTILSFLYRLNLYKKIYVERRVSKMEEIRNENALPVGVGY